MLAAAAAAAADYILFRFFSSPLVCLVFIFLFCFGLVWFFFLSNELRAYAKAQMAAQAAAAEIECKRAEK